MRIVFPDGVACVQSPTNLELWKQLGPVDFYHELPRNKTELVARVRQAYASRAQTSPQARLSRRTGRGRDGASASWPWTGHAARCVSRAGCGASPRSLRGTASRTVGGLCSGRSTPRPWRPRATPRVWGTAPARHLRSGPPGVRGAACPGAACPGSPSLGTPSSVCRCRSPRARGPVAPSPQTQRVPSAAAPAQRRLEPPRRLGAQPPRRRGARPAVAARGAGAQRRRRGGNGGFGTPIRASAMGLSWVRPP